MKEQKTDNTQILKRKQLFISIWDYKNMEGIFNKYIEDVVSQSKISYLSDLRYGDDSWKKSSSLFPQTSVALGVLAALLQD